MKEIFNPNLYHGANKNNNFFEGWYFKIVDRFNLHKLAIIPGVSYGNNKEDSHSFIQIINGYDTTYNYLKYDVEDFKFNNSNKKFRVCVNSNIFTLDHLNLNIIEKDLNIKGYLVFKNIVKWPSNIFSPGSMGWYNYIKFMECYSQVCILNGSLVGSLDLNNKTLDFTGGKIYIEKNWGKSFPKSWLWIQSNSFKNRSVSLTCSLGEVPFCKRKFQGHIIGLTIDNKFISFTTMNRSKVNINRLGNDITLTAQKRNLKLTLKTYTNDNEFILCNGPQNGTMSPMVKETLSGSLYLLLEDTKKHIILYEDIGKSTGIEYGGNLINKLK